VPAAIDPVPARASRGARPGRAHQDAGHRGPRPADRGAGGEPGASLELLQPLVDALDPQRAIIRFDMPGLGGSPAPVVPYHLATAAQLLSGVLDQAGYQQADVLGIS
jgi:pimeloyl-ACP methyl ester carboxylesterase